MRRISVAFVAFTLGACSTNAAIQSPGTDAAGTHADLAGSQPTGGADMATKPVSGPLPTAFGTYIELGDSISDRGGEGPFFYDLLFQNDDTAYPAWKGLDLKPKLAVQMHVHGAVGGAQSKDVPGQVTALPATLPGPVLVTI